MDRYGYVLPDFVPGSESRDGYDVSESPSLAGDNGLRAAGDNELRAAGDNGFQAAGENGSRAAGDNGFQAAGDNGSRAAGDNGLRAAGEPGGVDRQLEVDVQLHRVGEDRVDADRSSVGTCSEADSEESELTLDPAAIPNFVPSVSDRRGKNI